MADLSDTFTRLRDVLLAHSSGLERVTDTATHLYLNTRHLQPNKKPLFFGSVQAKKSGISVHLMPLYTHPELLNQLSPLLRQRMQGKSCFNFSGAGPVPVAELAEITLAAIETYRKAGYVE